MRRTTHMKNEPSGKSAQATMGQRALCMLLSATLAFSSMPSAALRAFAEEQNEPELTANEADFGEGEDPEQGPTEVEPGEGASTDPEDPIGEPTGENADPDSEGTTTPDQPTSDEPAPADDDQQPVAEDVDSTQEAETPSEAPAEQPDEVVKAEAETVTVSIEASQGIVPATDSVTLTAVGPDGTTLEDGSYLAPNVLLTVAGSKISGSELPTVTLTYKDIRDKTHTKSYVLSNDDAENQQWVDGGGVYVATVHVDTPGTYVSASISGGSCFYDEEYVELKGSVDFSPQFRVAGVELAEIIMLDKNGDKIVDDEKVGVLNLSTLDWFFNGIEIKPYLRPLPSMTKSEALEIAKLLLFANKRQILNVATDDKGINIIVDDGVSSTEGIFYYYDEIVKSLEIFDYLNAKHFDVRGILPNGLGIAAVGDDNPYKEEGGTK